VTRICVVTGGASGIGRATVERLAGEGATIEVFDRAVPQDLPPGCSHRLIDVGDAAEVQAAVAEVLATHGRIDVLVNCAGIIRRQEEHDPAVFAQVLDINLNGTMRTCAAARPKLAATQGCIINTASMLSFFGGGLVPGYSASKGGVAQLTKSLAIAYAAEHIRVNAIAPGWIRTPLTQALQDDDARSTGIINRTPLGRWGTPDDVAGAALLLASPWAGFITGAVLPVDGGYLIN
jgi:NAD(P)-dependent dehydrogenase (short-subunit alcohol dehydrogenase family)